MCALQLPPCPPSLRSIQHYLKTATEHDSRDPVISYWCRLYSLQTALKIDKKSDDSRALLMMLMEWLEKEKKVLADNEAVTNEVAAQAHVENYALRLFSWADSQDRSGIFNKNVVKTFYTSAMLMDVLSTFGEPSEEIAANCKYAKWKAAYIHNCLKNGETPVPGPVGWSESKQEDEDENFNVGAVGGTNNIGFSLPNDNASPRGMSFPPTEPGISSSPEPVEPSGGIDSTSSFCPQPATTPPPDLNYSPSTGSSVKLEPNQISKAQKYCKFAASALNYDDIPEAINNLQKALRLLTTGQDC